MNDVDDEILGAPTILVLGKASRLNKLVRYATTVIPGVEITKTLYRFGFSIQFCYSIAESSELKQIDVAREGDGNTKPSND